MSLLHFLAILPLIISKISSSALGDRYDSLEDSYHQVNRRLFVNRQPISSSISFKATPVKDTAVFLHQNVQLTCSARGSPPPTIHWLFNDTRIPQGPIRTVTDDEAIYEEISSTTKPMPVGLTNTRLYLDCVKPQDIGKYTCVAETPRDRIVTDTFIKIDHEGVGDGDSCLVKKATHGVPARIYMWTSLRIGIEGSTVQLFCRADGYPLPKITWYENGDVIDSVNENYELLPNGDLLIHRLSYDQNILRYECEAKNSLGLSKETIGIYAAADSVKPRSMQ